MFGRVLFHNVLVRRFVLFELFVRVVFRHALVDCPVERLAGNNNHQPLLLGTFRKGLDRFVALFDRHVLELSPQLVFSVLAKRQPAGARSILDPCLSLCICVCVWHDDDLLRCRSFFAVRRHR